MLPPAAAVSLLVAAVWVAEAASGTTPSGEVVVGKTGLEPACDDLTGAIRYPRELAD
jgi:hypothetical protein